MRVTRVFFGLTIKKWQIGDQIDDHNRGELGDHPEASRAWDFDSKTGKPPIIFLGPRNRLNRYRPAA